MTMMMAPSKAVLAGKADAGDAPDEVFTEGEVGDVASTALQSPLGAEEPAAAPATADQDSATADQDSATDAETPDPDTDGAADSPGAATADAAADTAVS